MDADGGAIRELLAGVQSGAVNVDEAVGRLRGMPFEDIGDAKLDHHRALRTGLPEVVFGQGKTPEQLADAMHGLARAGHSGVVMATRADIAAYEATRAVLPEAIYFERARIIALAPVSLAERQTDYYIAVATGGTADMPVAEEAAITAELLGHSVERFYDVGVAGIHRLFAHHDALVGATVVIVVAGMEGALASVVSGLVSCPVVAVPTSIGYGASFGGLAALLSMLNSCAPGVAVVNIDNGFGAAAFAHLLLRERQLSPHKCE